MPRGNARGSYGYPSPWNETGSTDPNTPDVSGTGIYFDGIQEVQKYHLLASGPMDETPNSLSGEDVMGVAAPGEPNPSGKPQI